MKKRNLLVAPIAASLVFCNLAVAANAQESTTSPIVINEVESNGDPIGDFVEIANTDLNNTIDISGWTLVDEKDTNPVVLPEGTEIESGGYFVIYTDAANYVSTYNTYGGIDHFGLGKDDTVTLRDAEGNTVDTYSWKELGKHAENTYGRIPDMAGEFADTGASTPGAKNIAADDSDVDPGTAPNAQLPFHNVDVQSLDLGPAFTIGDMSGVDFDENGTAWVVNNGTGTLYALAHDPQANTYELIGQWNTTYPSGEGRLDAEGVAAADNGDIYIATERNNAESNVSRPSVLRFANPTGQDSLQVAAQEWNLSAITGPLGANGGLEAIVQLEDTIFAVGVESTGEVLIVDLAGDEAVLVQRYVSSFEGVMALDYNSDTKQLAVVCDEACDGASEILTWDGASVTKADDNIYERPANLGNWANEGFATYTTELECIDGSTIPATSYLWADDAATNNFNALNAAQVIDGDCELAPGNDDDDDDDNGNEPTPPASPSDNSSTSFAAGSFAGSLATTLLAAFGIAGALGGLMQQLIAAFPTLKQYIRF